MDDAELPDVSPGRTAAGGNSLVHCGRRRHRVAGVPLVVGKVRPRSLLAVSLRSCTPRALPVPFSGRVPLGSPPLARDHVRESRNQLWPVPSVATRKRCLRRFFDGADAAVVARLATTVLEPLYALAVTDVLSVDGNRGNESKADCHRAVLVKLGVVRDSASGASLGWTGSQLQLSLIPPAPPRYAPRATSSSPPSPNPMATVAAIAIASMTVNVIVVVCLAEKEPSLNEAAGLALPCLATIHVQERQIKFRRWDGAVGRVSCLCCLLKSVWVPPPPLTREGWQPVSLLSHTST